MAACEGESPPTRRAGPGKGRPNTITKTADQATRTQGSATRRLQP
jgi:hypothetical protein